ncbi:cell wall-binding repeat-containing protein [Clostridium sp. BJN0013]|uniref:cell wall-binding repeat-containing protein n=1 Tax=Clostridium sp. BJN0013 TaxID=3236840 RepID=UPI0034C64D80
MILPKRAFADSERLWGQDRYETSAAVSKSGWTTSDYVILASGEDYADALSIAPIAASQSIPILLTVEESLPDVVKSYIKEIISDVITVGNKYLEDSSYDYSEDAENIKALCNSLSSSEKVSLENAVIDAGISLSDLITLADKLGISF